jgi:nickel-dependent lactate racemase
MLDRPDFTAQDQWQIQVQAQIQRRADVYVYSDGLSQAQIERALFIPCRDIEGTLGELLEKYGPQARVCVMPEGPQLIPYLREGVPIV